MLVMVAMGYFVVVLVAMVLLFYFLLKKRTVVLSLYQIRIGKFNKQGAHSLATLHTLVLSLCPQHCRQLHAIVISQCDLGPLRRPQMSCQSP